MKQKRQIIIHTLFLALFTTGARAAVFAPDSSADSSAIVAVDYQTVRGIERDEYSSSLVLVKTVNGILFVPRKLADGLLLCAAAGGAFLDDKRIISKFEDVFYLYKKQLGWFPLISYSSGISTGYGLHLFYEGSGYELDFKGAFRNRDRWQTRLRYKHQMYWLSSVWDLRLTYFLRSDDDLRFYGIGASPSTDPRSHFVENASGEYGLFRQQRNKIEASLALRPTPDWSVQATIFHQVRFTKDFDKNDPQSLSNVFDLSTLPGYPEELSFWYPELSILYDSREKLKLSSNGMRGAAYFGLVHAADDTPFDIVRFGADFTLFHPIISDNRILVSRLTFDGITTISNNGLIPYTEYPRHPAFRGVSSRELLRSDNLVLVPSIEYQWPLTYHLDAHIFYDRLLVAESIDQFRLKNAPWAVGVGGSIHNDFREFAKIYFSYGSERWYVTLKVGFDKRYDDRTDWK